MHPSRARTLSNQTRQFGLPRAKTILLQEIPPLSLQGNALFLGLSLGLIPFGVSGDGIGGLKSDLKTGRAGARAKTGKRQNRTK